MPSLVFQTFAGPPFGVRGATEHSSVMSMVPVSSYIKEMRRLACVPTKNENRDLESRVNIHETVRQTILHAVPPPRGTEPLTRWTW
jgi:hypothetical protein